MPELIAPQTAVAPAVRAANGADPDPNDAYAQVAHLDDAGLAAWVQALLADTREGAPRPEGLVPSTHLWWVDGEDYLGRVHVRHRLTPWLREVGGHVGYLVVPAHRRRGHATAMLAATKPVLAALGIECALVTCDADNVASRRVIETNGGLFCDQRGPKLRFWLPAG